MAIQRIKFVSSLDTVIIKDFKDDSSGELITTYEQIIEAAHDEDTLLTVTFEAEQDIAVGQKLRLNVSGRDYIDILDFYLSTTTKIKIVDPTTPGFPGYIEVLEPISTGDQFDLTVVFKGDAIFNDSTIQRLITVSIDYVDYARIIRILDNEVDAGSGLNEFSGLKSVMLDDNSVIVNFGAAEGLPFDSDTVVVFDGIIPASEYMEFSNGVTYDNDAKTLTIPSGVTEFDLGFNQVEKMFANGTGTDKYGIFAVLEFPKDTNNDGDVSDLDDVLPRTVKFTQFDYDNPTISSITSFTVRGFKTLSHTVTLSDSPKLGKTFKLTHNIPEVHSDYPEDPDQPSYILRTTNGVTWDKSTNRLIVPKLIETFEIKIDIIDTSISTYELELSDPVADTERLKDIKTIYTAELKNPPANSSDIISEFNFVYSSPRVNRSMKEPGPRPVNNTATLANNTNSGTVTDWSTGTTPITLTATGSIISIPSSEPLIIKGKGIEYNLSNSTDDTPLPDIPVNDSALEYANAVNDEYNITSPQLTTPPQVTANPITNPVEYNAQLEALATYEALMLPSALRLSITTAAKMLESAINKQTSIYDKHLSSIAASLETIATEATTTDDHIGRLRDLADKSKDGTGIRVTAPYGELSLALLWKTYIEEGFMIDLRNGLRDQDLVELDTDLEDRGPNEEVKARSIQDTKDYLALLKATFGAGW